MKVESEKVNKIEPDAKFKRQRLEVEQEERVHFNPKQVNPDLLRQAQNIFGDPDDPNPQIKLDSDRNATASNLKELFNADEIDDPFNTENDLRISKTDIPERY